MGAFCSKCQSYQPLSRTLTVDQKPAKKATEVLGFELGCGHKYGNEEFMAIQEKVNKIKSDFAKKQLQLEEDQRNELSKALAVMQGSRGGK